MHTRSLIAAAAAAAILLPGSAAVAADLGTAGWWTQTGLPAEATPPVALPVPAPTSASPDAPAGSLVVHGGPQLDQPVSFAAVEFVLGENEKVTQLKLTPAEGTASNPQAKLVLCPISGTFSAVEGGSMAEAPKFDCGTKSEGTAAEDGFTFDVSSLPAEGSLTVAILGATPADRVVLARPDSESVVSSGGSGGSDIGSIGGDGSISTDGFGTDASTTGGGFSDSFSGSSSFSVPGDSSLTGIDAPAVAGGGSASRLPSSVGPSEVALDAAPVSSGTDDGGNAVVPLFVALLVLLAGGLWIAAGRSHGPLDPIAAP